MEEPPPPPPPRSRKRMNTVNLFQDPAINKSLPDLPREPPHQDPHHAPSVSVPSPAKPPLASSPQFTNPPSQMGPLVRNPPSVKEIAKVFDQKETSTSDLGSRNPFRNLDSPPPPVPTINLDHQLNYQSQSSPIHLQNGEVGNSSSLYEDGENRVISMDSIATSAGPGPDIGYIPYSQEPPQDGTEIYDYNANGHGFLEPPSRVGSPESLRTNESEWPTERNAFSPTLHRRIGHEFGMIATDSRQVNGRAMSMDYGRELSEENNPDRFTENDTMQPATMQVVTEESEEVSEGEGYQQRDRRPTTAAQMLIEEHQERLRRGTTSTTARQNPPPVPPPFIPICNSQRQPPLWQQGLPVVPQNVAMSPNPFGSSPQTGLGANLDLERQRMETPSFRNAHMHNPPKMIRIAAEIQRQDGIPLDSGGGTVLRSVPFWVSVIIVQFSMLSTTAAVTAIIRDQRSSPEYVEVGNKTIFWLVISIVVFAVSGTTTLFVWARNMGYFSDFNKKLGVDEVGLLDRVMQDSETTRASGVESLRHGEGAVDLEANAGASSVYSRRPRAFETTPDQNGLLPLRLVSGESSVQHATRNRAESSAYAQTPIYPRPPRAQDSANGMSPFAAYPSSPLTPLTPALVKGTPGFPPMNAYAGNFLTAIPGYPFNNRSVPENINHHPMATNGFSPLEDLERSPLGNLVLLHEDEEIHAAPAHQRHSIIASKRASSQERSRNVRENLPLSRSTRRVQTFESYHEPTKTIIEHESEDERMARPPTPPSPFPKRLNPKNAIDLHAHRSHTDLRSNIEKIKAGGRAARAGTLARSPKVANFADYTAGYDHSKTDSKFNGEPGMMMDDLNPLTGKASSSTFVSSSIGPSIQHGSENGHVQAESTRSGNPSKVQNMFDAMKDHLTEHHGQSLSSVLKAKKGKNNEEYEEREERQLLAA